ncbi:MAG: hypothetical protein DI585_06015 [Pseudomonas fluorescens]|nr:MAG: hypothetical protein DI585_06015 [Pseudomonas fluorescens]
MTEALVTSAAFQQPAPSLDIFHIQLNGNILLPVKSSPVQMVNGQPAYQINVMPQPFTLHLVSHPQPIIKSRIALNGGGLNVELPFHLRQPPTFMGLLSVVEPITNATYCIGIVPFYDASLKLMQDVVLRLIAAFCDFNERPQFTGVFMDAARNRSARIYEELKHDFNYFMLRFPRSAETNTKGEQAKQEYSNQLEIQTLEAFANNI